MTSLHEKDKLLAMKKQRYSKERSPIVTEHLERSGEETNLESINCDSWIELNIQEYKKNEKDDLSLKSCRNYGQFEFDEEEIPARVGLGFFILFV